MPSGSDDGGLGRPNSPQPALLFLIAREGNFPSQPPASAPPPASPRPLPPPQPPPPPDPRLPATRRPDTRPPRQPPPPSRPPAAARLPTPRPLPPPRNSPSRATPALAADPRRPRLPTPRRRPPPAPSPSRATPASPPTPAADPSPSCATPPPLAVEMPPRRALPRSSTGYHGVQLRLSSRWGTEITRGGERFWLGTFDLAELAARAYDVMVWRYDGGAGPRNFFDVDNLAAAEFVAPPFSVVTRAEERAVRREYMRMSIQNRDEAEMAAFRAAHPQHVAEELEFYAQLALIAELEAEEAAKKAAEDPDWYDKMVAEMEAEDAAEVVAKKAAEDGDSSDFDEDFWDKP
nr:uncharacterized protein LOC127326038 [Lolium perenne]